MAAPLSSEERAVPLYYQKSLDSLPAPRLDGVQKQFFKDQTGITDDEELVRYIVDLRARAFAIHPYPCIRMFAFTTLKILRNFAYEQFLHLGATRQGAIFIDIGCCFGTDVRKAIADGYPPENVVAADLQKGEYNGTQSTPETFPVPFVQGDAFDPATLAIVPPVDGSHPLLTPHPDLKPLTSLNPLHGRVSAIHAASLFHLFSQEKQIHLARAMAGLLSPESGSMIFGEQVSQPVTGEYFLGKIGEDPMFCQSPESWEQMWVRIFGEGVVKVETDLREVPKPDFCTIPLPLSTQSHSAIR
ncbi:hypothetical protein K488DRAFT_84243 [Vararia minispora EC-137]|uniref:Uncharacterized protein n=1 Tax=Vararia minispora EC-137 TaxID=1314806 RepID=A0ACB8QQJ9_9AGAM|nr:hypothetical protein K488DRAFT_84243 [Vararia minispora EC-137]